LIEYIYIYTHKLDISVSDPEEMSFLLADRLSVPPFPGRITLLLL
jgi:hypothetical protein